jgi:hypothetical protein
MERKTKTTVEIPEKLFRRAKARAALEGISLREFVLRGLQLAIQSPSPQIPLKRVAFPLIRASQDSPHLTDEMVAEALDSDEDIA